MGKIQLAAMSLVSLALGVAAGMLINRETSVDLDVGNIGSILSGIGALAATVIGSMALYSWRHHEQHKLELDVYIEVYNSLIAIEAACRKYYCYKMLVTYDEKYVHRHNLEYLNSIEEDKGILEGIFIDSVNKYRIIKEKIKLLGLHKLEQKTPASSELYQQLLDVYPRDGISSETRDTLTDEIVNEVSAIIQRKVYNLSTAAPNLK